MLRFDDTARTLALSVRDLVENGAPNGHLRLELAQRSKARLLLGQQVHQRVQSERLSEDASFRAEVTVKQRLVVDGWTVTLHGRVDGLTEDGGVAVVEELKSTALDSGRLFATTHLDWRAYVEQVEVYLLLLHLDGRQRPVGRLVLVSLLDGARHVLGVGLDVDAVLARVRAALRGLVVGRERKQAWLATRTRVEVPWPFDDQRPGQALIVAEIEAGVAEGQPVLVQAPTGLGKTAAVLHAALKLAFARGWQVYWATARTTQQAVAEDAVRKLQAAGLALRAVTITARDKACVNDVVVCTPERCRFARDYHDKLAEADLSWVTARAGQTGRDDLRALGVAHGVCPYQLAADVAPHVDVVIGDVHYLFDPGVRLVSLFGESLDGWLVVCDEAHHLVDRARDAGSPALSARLAREAAAQLAAVDADAYGPFIALAGRLDRAIVASGEAFVGPARDDRRVVAVDAPPFAAIADDLDALGVDYARLKLDRPAFAEGARDRWLELAWGALRFADVLATVGDETVAIASGSTGDEHLSLLCLDPSHRVGPKIARMAGFIGMSATLRPTDFHVDLLGIDAARVRVVEVGSPFPPENLRVLLAPRVSTAWRDRVAQAPATAALVGRCIAEVPGNVAVYFSSFAHADQVSGHLQLSGRELLLQHGGMTDADRQAWLDRLARSGPPVVLAAVLGGAFAEGIDLPPGALSAVIIVGPALPPVGLERDLLTAYYNERYGQGFRYASLAPGLTRVVQAAGRLVRRKEDAGVVVLVGRRFRWREYAELLPAAWQPTIPDDPSRAVRDFFAEQR